jgi:hypothetical protein
MDHPPQGYGDLRRSGRRLRALVTPLKELTRFSEIAFTSHNDPIGSPGCRR